MIRLVTENFAKVIVVLNIGGVMETEWFRANDRIQGALLAFQGGVEGGLAAADLGLRQQQNRKRFVFPPHARARLDPCTLLLSGTARNPQDVARYEQTWGTDVYDPCYSRRFGRKKANYKF